MIMIKTEKTPTGGEKTRKNNTNTLKDRKKALLQSNVSPRTSTSWKILEFVNVLFPVTSLLCLWSDSSWEEWCLLLPPSVYSWDRSKKCLSQSRLLCIFVLLSLIFMMEWRIGRESSRTSSVSVRLDSFLLLFFFFFLRRWSNNNNNRNSLAY